MCKHCDIVPGYNTPETRLVKSFIDATVDDIISFLQNQNECEKYNRIMVSNSMKAEIEHRGFPKIFSLYWVSDRIRFYESINAESMSSVNVKRPSTMSELHNEIVLDKAKRDISNTLASYKPPKLNVAQMGIDDGIMTVTISFPKDPDYTLMAINMFNIIQKALAEHEEEILNG